MKAEHGLGMGRWGVWGPQLCSSPARLQQGMQRCSHPPPYAMLSACLFGHQAGERICPLIFGGEGH